jgi:superfamily II DNA/RNA helicase
MNTCGKEAAMNGHTEVLQWARANGCTWTYVESAGYVVESYAEPVADFDGMGLREELLRGIFAYGLERPSVVQQCAIVPLAQGKHVITQAPSGTGRTTMMAVGILQQIDTSNNDTQALVVAPTRELSHGINRLIQNLGVHMDIKSHTCTTAGDATRFLSEGARIVVGTPGRIRDCLLRRVLPAERIKTIMLDDADEMLSRGCGEMIRDVFRLAICRWASSRPACQSASMASPKVSQPSPAMSSARRRR